MRAHRQHLLSANRDDLHDIGDLHLWNQRSSNIASHAFHAVAQFDLIRRDANGDTLFALPDQAAGVRNVLFPIDANSTPPNHVGVRCTGVAEAAFGQGVPAIPEPATGWMTGAGLADVLVAARRSARGGIRQRSPHRPGLSTTAALAG